MTKIQHGVKVNGILYGWIAKELYRLPCEKGNRSYGFKKMSSQMIGNNTGYTLGRRKYTLSQLRQMTVIINYNFNDIQGNDCPF